MVASNTKSEIWSFLDTSALFTRSESNLLSVASGDLIREYKKPSEPRIRWFIPQMVIDERRFQMRQEALELLPQVEKLGRLLGHPLCTEASINHSIDDIIDRQVIEFGLEVIQINTSSVDWEHLLRDSVSRMPPFSLDRKQEKGFRDSIILETVLQQISLASDKVCRIAFVIDDNLLRSAAEKRVQDIQKVRILDSLEGLKTN